MLERLPSLRRSALVGLVLAVPLGVLLAAPQASRAGGQGTGLPIPEFVDSFDPDFVLDAMNTSQAGAPAPRWVRLLAPATPCNDPQLAPLGPDALLTVVDGVGSSDVCVPDFVPGATLPAKVRVVRKLTRTPVSGTPGEEDEVVRVDVEMTLTLSVIVAGAAVQVQSLVVPPSSFEWKPFDNEFDPNAPPPLVQEVGWFDGAPLCSGPLVLDGSGVQRISVERVAAGSSQAGSLPSIGVNGLNRAALVTLGQQALPALLCQPDTAGACTFTPAVVFVEPDGTLSEPTNESVVGDGAECDVTVRFARPAAAPPSQCEADLAVCQSDLGSCETDLASCLANPPTQDGDGDGEADATDRCAGTPAGQPVDDAGCSQAQFCAAFDVKTPEGQKSCRRADWRNDEPSDAQNDGDCRIARDARTKRDHCVPAS
jgi:hypothetical protein